MTSFDAKKNFAVGTVATAPSPATTGLTLSLTAGQGALFPDPGAEGAYNVVVYPAGAQPSKANAEIVRVTGRAVDAFTIVRAQEGSTARAIVVGDQVVLSVTQKTMVDLELIFHGNSVYAARRGAVFDDNEDASSPNVSATDNTTFLNDAIGEANALAAANGGAVVYMPEGGVGKITGALTPLADGVELDFRGSQLNPYSTNPGSPTTVNWISSADGVVGSDLSLAADAAGLATTLSLTSVAGLAQGNWVLVRTDLYGASPGIIDTHVTYLMDVNGGAKTLFLAAPLYRETLVANNGRVEKLTPTKRVAVRNLVMDGYQSFGLTNLMQQGILMRWSVDCEVTNCEFRNVGSDLTDHDAGGVGTLTGQSAGPVQLFAGANNLVERIRTFNCGSRNVAAVQLARQTGSTLHDVKMDASAGFGGLVIYGAANHVSDVRVVGTSYGGAAGQDGSGFHYGQGRGFKLQSSSYNRVSDVECSNAWDTAFGIVVNSRHNIVNNLIVTAAGWGALQAVGLWLDGTGNSFNIVRGMIARRQNTAIGAGSYFDVDVADGDLGNYIEGQFINYRDLNTATTGPPNVIVQLPSLA